MTTKKLIKRNVKHPVMTAEEKAESQAKVALLPSANAAAVVGAFGSGTFGEQDISALVFELRKHFEKVENGDMSYCESMLVGQANALQSIFVNLARKAANQEMLMHYETFLRLALKAQNQSRMTLETLAAIKNPPVVFAKQANINQGGNQQINNGTPAPTSRAEKNIIQQNEQLEVQDGNEILDTRTTSGTIEKDKVMETMD